MNASYTLLYIKAAMLKRKRKQCPCKPSSVFLYQICCYAVFISDIRMSVIYLVPKSPLGSSTLPSTAALKGNRTSRPQSAVYMSLQLPDGTAWRSPASWWSLTPPSHPYYPPPWESAGERLFSSTDTYCHQ